LNKYNKFNKINNYDKDSINVVESPLYTYPINERKKGGKVDLNNFGLIKNRGKDEDNEEEKELEDEYEIDEEKMAYLVKLQKYIKAYHQVKEIDATKIQSFWRGIRTRKIMSLYQDLDEFIYILSKVHFIHFSDNFYYFINQLFNVYKANTLVDNEIESLEKEEDEEDEEKEEVEGDKKKDEEEKKGDEEEKIEENNKNYDELLNDYNNLQKKYDDLIKNKFNKSSIKKNLLNNNNDIISVPGETTIGTIRTEKPKLKFKGGQNNSVSNFHNDNLTFSNDYNDEGEGKFDRERRFFTPNQEDEESFNDKDKRFSYSSIHSEENSKFFDNEHPNKVGTSSTRSFRFKNRTLKNPKSAILSLNKKKDKLFTYSPSIEIDKQSRGNSTNKNNENQNENRINNISVIIPKHEEDFGILNEDEKKKIEENAYDKYLNNYSKDLRIVKNNKINYENQDEKLNCFDNEIIFPENENNLELVAPKKSIEQQAQEVFDNEKLLEKIKNKISKLDITPPKIELKTDYGESFIIENKKPVSILDQLNNQIETNINNLEIIQNDHRNFSESKLDFESNELFLGKPLMSHKKKKSKNIAPISENKININQKYPTGNAENIGIFSKEKTLPSFNINNFNIEAIIKDIIPKTQPKFSSFNKDNMLIDNVYNSEFNFEDSSPKTDRKRLNQKEKEIIYLPIKNNIFKRLRRSKRTKETYFTIKSDINKIKENKENDKPYNKNDMIKICENKNFEIKSEYYYIETKDEQIPEIVKETIYINNQNKESNRFNDNKTIYSNENNFGIKSDRNKNTYLEDIEKNELIILPERANQKGKKQKFEDSHKEPSRLRKAHKKNNEIINNEGFIIDGEEKKWGDNDLNPEATEEFSFRNDLDEDILNYSNDEKEIEDNKIDENEDFVEEEVGEKEDMNNEQNISFNIEEVEQFEIIDKIKDKKENMLFVESKENIINLEGNDLSVEEKGSQIDIKQVHITTKKILKKEKVLSRKKFLNNQNASEDSFSIFGMIDNNNKDTNVEKSQNDNKKELILFQEKNCELTFKKLKKNKKENEEKIEQKKDFNNIVPISNDEFAIRRKKLKTKETETETTDEFINNNIEKKNEIILENINNENIIIKGKKKKMKEEETEIDHELINIEPYINHEINENKKKGENNIIIRSENLDLIAPEKEKKENIFEKTKIDNINLESRNRAFPKLDMNNCLYQTFNGIEKEKIILENIKNESIIFEGKEQEKDKEIPQKEEKDIKYYIESNQMFIVSKGKKLKDNERPKEKDESKIFKELNINKSEEYNILGKRKIKKLKKKKKLKESEAKDVDDLNSNIPEINNDLNNKESEPLNEENKEKPSKLRDQKKEKDIVPNSIEISNQFIIEGLKKDKNESEKENIEEVGSKAIEENKENNNRIFSNLNINKSEEHEFNGKEKEKPTLESFKNDSILFNGKEKEELQNIKNDSLLLSGKEKEKQILESVQNEPIRLTGKHKMKEDETQIDTEILNSNLIHNNNENFSYESIKPQKPKNIITKDNSILIKNEKKGKKLELIIEEQKPLNINNNKENKFNKDLISICYSENFEIKLKEEYELEEQKPQNNLSKKFNKLLISDNEKEMPELESNLINNLEESIENRMEIIGNQKISNIENKIENNQITNEEESPIDGKNDLESNMTKQFINNMVQDRLEKEKQKNMDQTKNKLIKLFKAIKLKNALGKNLKNKKYFIDRLKEIKNQKDKKKILSIGSAIKYNFNQTKERKEECTDTENLDKIYDKVYKKITNPSFNIEQNNKIEIKSNEKESTELNKEIKDQFTINKIENKINEIRSESTEKYNKIEISEIDKFSLNLQNKEKEEKEKNKENKVKKKKKKIIHKKNDSLPTYKTDLSEAKENDLNISGISRLTEDKEVQIEPIKEFKITTKKIYKKEISTKKKFLDVKRINIDSISIVSPEKIVSPENTKEEKSKKSKKKKKIKDICEVSTQTPKLRPANQPAKKVVFHEIKTIIKKEQKPLNTEKQLDETNAKFISTKKQNQEQINEEEEKKEDCNNVFKIETIKKILYLYCKNRIGTLQYIYFKQWKNLLNTKESDEKNSKLRRFFMIYPRIVAMKLLEFLEEYNDLRGSMLIVTNVIRKNILKIMKKNILGDKNEKIYYNSESQIKRKKMAFDEIESVVRKNVGKFLIAFFRELINKK